MGDGGYTYMFYVMANGLVDENGSDYYGDNLDVRPAVTLKTGTEITRGTGTIIGPYI